jgi:hypothetical protein
MRPLLALVLLSFAAQSALGATLYGPTPYRSAADSPFDLSGLGSTFYLEDFEDGELNTPGISWLGPPGIVLEPGTLTDSVDGDDGVIDGLGRDGRSLRSVGISVDFSDPPNVSLITSYKFDATALGFLPNAFGFVWTDGPPLGAVVIDVLDDAGNIRNHYYWPETGYGTIGDEFFDGGTADDSFYGIYDPNGFSRIVVWTHTRDDQFNSFELDHLQYGVIVPEPSTMACAATVILVCLLPRHTRRRRRLNQAAPTGKMASFLDFVRPSG